MKLLLDTCSIIWAVSEPEKLSNKAQEFLKHPDSQIFVSVISCAKIACATERGRIQIDRHWKIWFRYFVELNGWETVPIDLDIMGKRPELYPNDFDLQAHRGGGETAVRKVHLRNGTEIHQRAEPGRAENLYGG